MEDLVRFLLEKTGHSVPAGAISSSEEGARIEVKLPSSEVERLVSGEAKLVRAIRAILSAAASMKETKVTLEIVEVGA